MMKWITLIPVALLLTACGYTYTRSVDAVEYRQVVVSPPYETVTVVDDDPIDATFTEVDYY